MDSTYPVTFIDDEVGFRAWRARHPDGYVLNTTRIPAATYLILHNARCRTISGDPARGKYWTRQFIKVCSDDKSAIEMWTGIMLDAKPQPCKLCHPA